MIPTKRLLAYLYYLYHKKVTKNLIKSQMGYWFYMDGDNTHLANHNLNANSVVFEVGGYTGVFADKIIKKYDAYIYIFEPVLQFFEELTAKYRNNPKVKIYNFGLSNTTTKKSISIDADKSSLYKNNPAEIQNIELKDINDFLLETPNITKIDLLNINIEGGEYELLERIIKSNIIKRFDFIQVQFHNVVSDADKKRSNLIDKIKRTHNVAFSYPFVWDGFKLKEST